MKTTIFTCDRCKKEVEKLEEVGAGRRVKSYGYGGGERMEACQFLAEWCLECCIEMGITKLWKESPTPPFPIQPPPTLEDMIREIIREERGNG